MARITNSERKQSFSTRIAPATLHQLDQFVRWGKYPNRTAAMEAAVGRPAVEVDESLERRRRAVERTRGALSLGITPAQREAKQDYLDWLGDRLARG